MKYKNGTNQAYILVVISLLFLFLKGSLSEFFHVPGFIIQTAEGAIFSLMAVLILLRSTFIVPGITFIVLYLAWSFISTLYNDLPFVDFFTYSRYLFYNFIFFNIVYVAEFSKPQVKKILKLIAGLFFLQIIASLIEIFIFNLRDEYRVGTMFFGAGGYGTVLPMVAISYGLGIFYFKNRSFRVYFLTLSFIIVGFASGKRAIFFFIPALLLVGQIVFMSISRSIKDIARSILFYSIIIIPLLLAFVFFLGQSKRFEELNTMDSIFDKFSYIYDVAEEYSFRENSRGQRFGRGSNNMHMISLLSNGEYDEFFLGGGPNSCTRKYNYEMQQKYGFGYGIPGWIDDILCIGVPGSLLVLLLFSYPLFRMFVTCRFNEMSPLLKSIYFGNLMFFFTFIVINFYYFNCFSVDSSFSVIYFFMMALLLSPHYRQILIEPIEPSNAKDCNDIQINT